ncbi:TIGR03546 family protein [candidate division FCPU426 bacterium]|nr:TIGR03546 family protein [candidate division FCPU426 bacterium]
MFWLKAVRSLLAVLQSEDSPWQVAGGVALGMVMGFSPLSGIQNVVLFLLIMFLNVNVGGALLSAALFALLAALLDPLSHHLGYALLVQTDGLTPLWTSWYNAPIVPFTRFNNTVVMGSFILALLLFVPVMVGTRMFVVYYRRHWQDRVAKWKLVKWLKLTNIAVGVGKGR